MATLAKKAGLDGIVASPSEIIPVKEQIGKDFKVLTPGIRPLWSVHGDQKRICSPGEAAKRGADFLVIGRPIFGDRDPAYAFLRIMNEIKDAIK
jgi:orotidine-5'-phosphate decarboxylase